MKIDLRVDMYDQMRELLEPSEDSTPREVFLVRIRFEALDALCANSLVQAVAGTGLKTSLGKQRKRRFQARPTNRYIFRRPSSMRISV